MSRENDDKEIPVMEVHRRMTRSRVMSTEDISLRMEQKKKKKNSRTRSLESIYEEEENKKNTSPISKKKKKSLIRSLISIYEEEENKKKKNIPPISRTKEDEEKKPIPVYELRFKHLKLCPDDEAESEEETFGDRERPVEVDWGFKFVINEDVLTYTRVKHPVKVYYKSHELRSGSVLRDLNYPVSTVSKKALDRYNAIEGTNYEYVGLVKAYKKSVDGVHYTVRFKARLPDQDPINFQAMVWQRIPDRKNKVVVLHVEFVHPLP